MWTYTIIYFQILKLALFMWFIFALRSLWFFFSNSPVSETWRRSIILVIHETFVRFHVLSHSGKYLGCISIYVQLCMQWILKLICLIVYEHGEEVSMTSVIINNRQQHVQTTFYCFHNTQIKHIIHSNYNSPLCHIITVCLLYWFQQYPFVKFKESIQITN